MRSLRPIGLAGASLLLLATNAYAQTADTPIVAPADQTALVAAPKAAATVPTFDAKAADSTSLSLSAGGQLATGNSRLLAMTGNGVFAMRRSQHGFGASLIGNYGQGAPPGSTVVSTAENAQGKVRYDYFLSDRFSIFGLVTGRHDRFQGLDFRLNLDPGVKYLIINTPKLALWGEAGYDFQYDIRRDESLNSTLSSTTAGDVTTTVTEHESKTHADHAGRLYVGFHDDFNKNVALTTGIEYIQSVQESTRYWINYDALLTAGISGGLSFGFGLSMRYDHDPLPGKADLDTTTTLSLIYAFASAPAEAAAAAAAGAPCDCTNGGSAATSPGGNAVPSSNPATVSSPTTTPPPKPKNPTPAASDPTTTAPVPAPQTTPPAPPAAPTPPPAPPGASAPGSTDTTTVPPSKE